MLGQFSRCCSMMEEIDDMLVLVVILFKLFGVLWSS